MAAKATRARPLATPTVAPARAAVLRAELLAWYVRARRDLPWRATRDPYAIWISEAMLQQTRVEAVEPYWRRFLARFPDARALAQAGEDEVLALWSGLGYYRRARSLHGAARAIVARHGGAFPDSAAAVRELPGIGPYTAGAVLSIAFDRPEPLVDGNVERVLARLFALDGAAGSAPLRRATWAIAARLVPERGAGNWNQALMELGATVCTPRNPRCASCPLARRCAALEQGRASELPRARARQEPIAVELESLYVVRRARILLERRPEAGRMAGMWQLPTIEVPRESARGSGLFPERYAAAARLLPGAPLREVRHTITRHRIRAVLREGESRARSIAAPLAWFARDELGDLALTGMTRKLVRA